MKKRRLISVLLCISLFFAGGCGPKTAEKQQEIQETAEQQGSGCALPPSPAAAVPMVRTDTEVCAETAPAPVRRSDAQSG